MFMMFMSHKFPKWFPQWFPQFHLSPVAGLCAAGAQFPTAAPSFYAGRFTGTLEHLGTVVAVPDGIGFGGVKKDVDW